MNNGKICVSIFSEKADELEALLRRAETLADVVELRFDGLDIEQRRIAFQKLSSEKQVLLTMRPKEQGGRAAIDLNSRTAFWMEFALHKGFDQTKVWIDQEYDLLPQRDLMFWIDDCFVIRSKHYLEGQIADLPKAYETVVSDKEVGKIAVAVDDAAKCIPIWKLLEKATAAGKRVIPIAMGEAGKWTRILGPAYGAFLTYGSLETGAETAAGQISAEDMIDFFRVRELDRDTSVFGLLAGNTSYSISPWMHNAAFKAAGLNSVFVPFQTQDLETFIARMVRPETREIDLNLAGLSVTNPHKETIIPFLDEIDETAERIGAVNTVKIVDGRLIGFNTDAKGFISTLTTAMPELAGARIALFGAGGAARACLHTLRAEGAVVTVFARNEEKGKALAKQFGAEYEPSAGDRMMSDDFDAVVNATPLGTKGSNEKFTVLTAARLSGLKFVYDLVYNPAETRLMREAADAAVPSLGGMEMIVAQGAEQFEIWTGHTAPIAEMRAAAEKKLAL